MATDLEAAIRSWVARPTRQDALTELREVGAVLGTSAGPVRPQNQDKAVVARYASENAKFFLAVLCDGMGGMTAGKECAEIAISALVASLTVDSGIDVKLNIARAVSFANNQVYAAYKGEGGTTMVGIINMGGDVQAFSIGDSRIYSTRSSSFHQVTVDDTIAGEISRYKGRPDHDATVNPLTKGLTQFVGIGPSLEPRFYSLSLLTGSTHILSSDGAHSIPHQVLEQIVLFAPSTYAVCTRLLQLARWRGGQDNATLICCTEVDEALLQARLGILEIWDSFAKLEIHVEPLRNATIDDLQVIDQPDNAVQDSESPKKRVGKQKRNARKPPKRREQQPLEIEINPRTLSNMPVQDPPDLERASGQEKVPPTSEDI